MALTRQRPATTGPLAAPYLNSATPLQRGLVQLIVPISGRLMAFAADRDAGVTFSYQKVVTVNSGSGTVPVPVGTTSVQIDAWGGGPGGPGGASNAASNCAPGAGSGAYVQWLKNSLVSPAEWGNALSYSVGANGTGGNASGSSPFQAGTAGGTTTVSGTCAGAFSLSAPGGQTFSPGAAPDPGGPGGTPATGGTTNTNGNTGGASVSGTTGAGAGAPNGGANTGTRNTNSAVLSQNGSAPGGGGEGGCGTTTSAARKGGDGAPGRVTFTFTITVQLSGGDLFPIAAPSPLAFATQWGPQAGFKYNGSSQAHQMAGAALGQATECTMMVFGAPSSVSATSKVIAGAAKTDGTGVVCLKQDGTAGTLAFVAVGDTGTTNAATAAAPAGVWADNRPAVLIGRRSAARNVMQLFVNGAAGASTTYSSVGTASFDQTLIGCDSDHASGLTSFWGGGVFCVAIWNRALTDAEIQTLSLNPWAMLAANDVLGQQTAPPDVAVTGTGALTAPSATASATGTHGVTGTSAVTAPSATASATGTHGVTGTGACTFSGSPASASGTGLVCVTGTGACTFAGSPASSSATGDHGVAGTGALTSPIAAAAATGSHGVTGTSAVTAPSATASATGLVYATGTGACTFAGSPASCSGTGSTGPIGTGALTAPVASASASGNHGVAGTAAVTAPSATASATGLVCVTGSAAVTAPSAFTITAGDHGVAGASSFSAPSATASGTGLVCVTGTGACTFAGSPASCSASGSTGPIGTGALTSPVASASASGDHGVAGTAAVTAPSATASAAGLVYATGTGACTAPSATCSGTGTFAGSGFGDVTAPSASASASGDHGVTGSGACSTSSCTADGTGLVAAIGTGACTFSGSPSSCSGTGTHGVTGTGAVPAPITAAAGAGVHGVTGTGAASIAPTADASGTVGVLGTGACTAPSAFCFGANDGDIVGTGALTTPSATVASGPNGGTHGVAGTGACVTPSATCSGAETAPAPDTREPARGGGSGDASRRPRRRGMPAARLPLPPRPEPVDGTAACTAPGFSCAGSGVVQVEGVGRCIAFGGLPIDRRVRVRGLGYTRVVAAARCMAPSINARGTGNFELVSEEEAVIFLAAHHLRTRTAGHAKAKPTRKHPRG